jgi:hypothetical protein
MINKTLRHALVMGVASTGCRAPGAGIGDAGDGNGNDHGDWAMPTLTCT